MNIFIPISYEHKYKHEYIAMENVVVVTYYNGKKIIVITYYNKQCCCDNLLLEICCYCTKSYFLQ